MGWNVDGASSDPTASLSADEIVAKFTGTPNGALFLRDDGTLAAAGGTDASALATGTVALARGGTNANLSATGGTTHFLRQASAGAAVTVGAIADGDLPAGSNAAAIALKAPIASPTFTGTVTSPATTQTGPIQFTGTQSSVGASNTNIYRTSSGSFASNAPSGGGHNFLVNSVNQGFIDATGLNFPTAHTTLGSTAFGAYRNDDQTFWLGPTAGASTLAAAAGAVVQAFGGTHATAPGLLRQAPSAVSLANSATRTIDAAATGLSGFVELIDKTNHRVARYSVNNGTPTKDSGHSQFVAGAPGAGEVGLELSSTTLRVNNGSGGALLIAIHAILPY